MQLLRSGSPETAGIALRRALEVLDRERRPQLWTRAATDLGHAKLALGDREGARATWREVALRLTTEAHFAQGDVAEWTGWLNDVTGALRALDQDGLPRPRVRLRPDRGRLLYLRPLVSSGSLRLANAFRDPGALEVQFDVEPETLTLEAALYRVLGPAFEFTTIGGAADGLGATRLFSAGGLGWQEQFDLMVRSATVIAMVPHDSPGVQWELEQLRGRGLLGRCLFIQPPGSAGLVTGGARLLARLGIGSPAYEPSGQLFRVDAGGSLRDVLPFEEVWAGTLAGRL
jgi:hypothetical protein